MENIHNNFNKNEIDILSNLGLSDKEALIYLAALQTGGGTISDLAEAANIERTGIYYHIEKLQRQKLLKTLIKGKRTIYLPADPDRLKKIADHNQQSFNHLFPQMQERFSRETGKSIIKYYEGREEVGLFYDDVYQIIKKMEPPENKIYILGTSFYTVAKTDKSFLKFTPPKERLNTITKAILPASRRSKNPESLDDQPYIMTRYNLPPAELKFIEDKYVYPSSVVITQKHIILYDWRNLIFSITENENNAATWRSFFRLTWDHLPAK